MATFKVNNYNVAVEYCSKNIGPRRYWLHNKLGGEGWSITRTYYDNKTPARLTIEDEKKALLAMLALSDR